MDDGSVRVLALDKAATDTAVTGKPYTGTPTQGLASYYSSYYAMWGVHVSRESGLVAYCGSDGNVLQFHTGQTGPEFRRDFLARRNAVLKWVDGGAGFIPNGNPLDMEKPGNKKKKADEGPKPSKKSKNSTRGYGTGVSHSSL